MTNRVNAVTRPSQEPTPDSILNRPPTHPEPQELVPRYEPMLPLCQVAHALIKRT